MMIKNKNKSADVNLKKQKIEIDRKNRIRNHLKIKNIEMGMIQRTDDKFLFIFEIYGKNIELMNSYSKLAEVNAFATLFKTLSFQHKIRILSIDKKVDLDINIKKLSEKDNLTHMQFQIKKEVIQNFGINGSMSNDINQKNYYLIVESSKKEEYHNLIPAFQKIQFNEMTSFSIEKLVYNYLHQNGIEDDLILNDSNLYPSKIKKFTSKMQVGNKFKQILLIKDLKYEMDDVGLLNKLHKFKGVTSILDIKSIDNSKFVTKTTSKITHLKSQLNYSKTSEMAKARLSGEINLLTKSLQKMNKDNEILLEYDIFIELTADTDMQLRDLYAKVDSVAKINSVVIDDLELQQNEAFISMCFWNKKIVKYKNNSFSQSVASLFPMQVSSLIDESGLFLGTSFNNELIMPDFYSKLLPNPNYIIVGASGQGKSVTQKKIISHYSLLKNTKIIIFDSDNQEYHDITANLGGTTITPSSSNIINILQVRTPNTSNDDFDVELVENSIFNHISWIKKFFKIYKPEISEIQIAILEFTLLALYDKFNITHENVISKTNKDFPTLGNLLEELRDTVTDGQIGEDKIDEKEAETLIINLKSIVEGTDSIYFNGHSSVNFNSEVVNIDISNLNNLDINLRQAVLFNYINYVWDYISSNDNNGQRKLLILDELYLLVNRNNNLMVEYVNMIQKRCRKYQGLTGLATQQLNDLNDDKIKNYTNALLSNPSTKIIYNVGDADSRLLKELLQLEKHEIERIISAQKMTGLLKYGQQNFMFNTKLLNAESSAFGDRGRSFVD